MKIIHGKSFQNARRDLRAPKTTSSLRCVQIARAETIREKFEEWLYSAPPHKIPRFVTIRVELHLQTKDWLILASVAARNGESLGLTLSNMINSESGISDMVNEIL